MIKYFLNLPNISYKESAYVKNVLKTNWLSSNGKHNIIAEKKFCKLVNKKYSITVQSGTAALHVILKSIDANKDSKVIIPNYSCSANINSVAQCNSTAVVVEVEKETLGLDYNFVKKAIYKHKPIALQLVHIYGCPARDTLKILNLCKKKNILVIEDGSESLGARINNKKVGEFGDVSIFSLRSEKMLGVGEGAIICTNSKKLYEKILLLCSRNMPFRKRNDPYWKKYISNGEGYNYLMPHLLSAMLRGQIERHKNIFKEKVRVGNLYRKIFKNFFNFAQIAPKNFYSVHWLNAINLDILSTKEVRKVGEELMKSGIEVRSGFWPLINTKNVKTFYVGGERVSNKYYNKVIVLPSNYKLKSKDILFIRNQIIKIINYINPSIQLHKK
jgi:perosamine synthetase